MKGLPGVRIEVRRLVAEGFAIDGAPDQSAVGVDVHLGDAELGGRQILFFRHAAGRSQFSAGLVDTFDPVHGHAARTVHDQRKAGQDFLDGLDAVEVQPLLALELVGPVRGADGHGQRIAAAAFDEFDRLVGIGKAGVIGIETLISSSTPPSMPSSASTEMPFSWARSTTRRVVAILSSNDSCEASIITDE